MDDKVAWVCISYEHLKSHIEPRVYLLNVSATAGCVDFNIITVNMNNSSRKVKNPLLSAAGPGFPFDSYAENTLLVPVKPASTVLRDGEFIQRETLGEVQHIIMT